MLKRRRGDRLGSHAEAPRQLAHGGWRTIIRHGLPGIAATILGVVLSIAVALAGGPPPSAYCIDPNNGIKYVSADGQRYYWYAQVQTANGGCNSNGCPYVYTYTQGGKGNLNTRGLPYTWDDAVQHVSEWMGSYENPAHCTTSNQTGTGGCWVQLGWTVGYASSCGGTIDPTSVTVYVEIYDDSSSPCYLATYGGAPSNASYDARFYTTLGNGLHRYQVYYEVPGSNNIQDLAYGDLKDQTTAEIAAGEAASGAKLSNGNYRDCPVLGQINSGDWNIDGQPASQGTFASYMNLYTGSWQNWTTSVAPTSSYATYPYEIQGISNFGSGTYTEWQSGGPN